ncbi:hypothetical protein GUITHDRAFT_111978 [Guillardia theta CCMP2712]|uniref:Uncharacterized protein n=1 Tax=Guillardia theta (strain CCMP2712) TaxID=905079 RepID=L1J210_GUITC|nr:hypothetical protein GUITHDRAFT_111978 [Guillardia theta CCMP2712]EKX42130.1 hypothetical protein GUITHDRAFT_111978 [Guillardia theta CCMP2712]|eukprot:XP_005829110.1 hypothetical protein GUITHDRAFT_111978 [Guillardia theta CCMP2712]
MSGLRSLSQFLRKVHRMSMWSMPCRGLGACVARNSGRMMLHQESARWTARRLGCPPLRRMSAWTERRVEGVMRFEFSSPQLGHAIRSCAEEADRAMSSLSKYLSLVVIYPPNSEEHEEQEEQELVLPEALRRNSLTMISRTFTDKNAKGYHVSISVLKLEDGVMLEMFTAEQDGLPQLDSYRQLLARDQPSPFFFLATTGNTKRKELFKKLEMLFPEASKFMCQVKASRLFLNGVPNKLCVGFVLQSKEHGEQMKTMIMELFGEMRLADLKTDLMHGGDPKEEEYIRENMWAAPVVSGLFLDMVVFEPRYRLMVKTCVDHGALFVLTKPGEKVRTMWIPRGEDDGMMTGWQQVFEDEPIAEEDGDTAEMIKSEILGNLSKVIVGAEGLNLDMMLSRLAKLNADQLSFFLIPLLPASTERKYRWYEMKNSLERMRMQCLRVREIIEDASEVQ